MDKLNENEFVPTGHFYSAVPSLESKKNFAFPDTSIKTLSGINLRENEQFLLLRSFKKYHDECRFQDKQNEEARYYFDNPAYSYGDAIALQSMIRHFNPKRYIEVGSGFSSAAVRDTLDDYNIDCSCTFIEPYPDLLKSLLYKENDRTVSIIGNGVQQVELGIFKELGANDILFIDSTHVSKLSSDVNYLIHEVLPILNPGVLVHFHDIFWPFEYPAQWVREGRAWNESYLLRAFLEFNSAFEIVFFSTYLYEHHREWIIENMPKMALNPGGDIWLRRIS